MNNTPVMATAPRPMVLDHLSASTINLFIKDKASFFMKTVGPGRPYNESPATARGKAVEHAVNRVLEGATAQEAINEALDKYFEMIQSKDDEYYTIEPLAVLAIGYYKDAMPKAKTQTKGEVLLPGCSIPILMYVDFMDSMRISDCKTSAKTPSSLSQDYIVQGSIYQYAYKKPLAFDFFVPLKGGPKHTHIELGPLDYSQGIRYAEYAARTIEEVQRIICPIPELGEVDPVAYEMFRKMSFPNLDILWNKDEVKQVSKFYGLS